MEDEKMRRIIEYLSTQGKTWDMLTKNEQGLLLKVHDEIYKRLPRISEAETVIAKNAINQSSIAEAIGTTRKTVGSNNKIIAGYIDKHSTNTKKEKFSKNEKDEIQRLVSENERYKIRLAERLDHEIIEEELKAKIFQLEETLKLERTRYRNLEEENLTLKDELARYRKEEIELANDAHELELICAYSSTKGIS